MTKPRTQLKQAASPQTWRLCGLLGAGFLLLVAVWLLPVFQPLVLRSDMVWNTFLALLPLGFSLLARWRLAGGGRGFLFWLPAVFWGAFFPNAPYMLTDLIHLARYDYHGSAGYLPSLSSWLGFCHIVLGVAVGAAAGCLSLYLLHEPLRRRYGRAAGWGFCAAISLLAGAGIYIGRFLRFNSWDLITRPGLLLEQLLELPLPRALSLTGVFSLLCFGCYCLFWACFYRSGRD